MEEELIPQYLDLLRTAALGGAMQALAQKFPSMTDKEPEDREVLAVMNSGLRLGAHAVVEHLEGVSARIPKRIEKLGGGKGPESTTPPPL